MLNDLKVKFKQANALYQADIHQLRRFCVF